MKAFFVVPAPVMISLLFRNFWVFLQPEIFNHSCICQKF